MTFEELRQKYHGMQTEEELAQRDQIYTSIERLSGTIQTVAQTMPEPYASQIREWVEAMDMLSAQPPEVFENPVRQALEKAGQLQAILNIELPEGGTVYDYLKNVMADSGAEAAATLDQDIKNIDSYFELGMDLSFIPEPEPEAEPEQTQEENHQDEAQQQTQEENHQDETQQQTEETEEEVYVSDTYNQLVNEYRGAIQNTTDSNDFDATNVFAQLVTFYTHTVGDEDGNRRAPIHQSQNEIAALSEDPAFRELVDNMSLDEIKAAAGDLAGFLRTLEERRAALQEQQEQPEAGQEQSEQQPEEAQEQNEQQEAGQDDEEEYRNETYNQNATDFRNSLLNDEYTSEDRRMIFGQFVVFYSHTINGEDGARHVPLNQTRREIGALEEDPAFRSLLDNMTDEQITDAVRDIDGFLQNLEERRAVMQALNGQQEPQPAPGNETENVEEEAPENQSETQNEIPTYAQLQQVYMNTQVGDYNEESLAAQMSLALATYLQIENGHADEIADMDQLTEQARALFDTEAFGALRAKMDEEDMVTAVKNPGEFLVKLQAYEAEHELNESETAPEEENEVKPEEQQIEEQQTEVKPEEQKIEEQQNEVVPEEQVEESAVPEGGITYDQYLAEAKGIIAETELDESTLKDVVPQVMAAYVNSESGMGEQLVDEAQLRADADEFAKNPAAQALLAEMDAKALAEAIQDPAAFFGKVYERSQELGETEKEQTEPEKEGSEKKESEIEDNQSEIHTEEEEIVPEESDLIGVNINGEEPLYVESEVTDDSSELYDGFEVIYYDDAPSLSEVEDARQKPAKEWLEDFRAQAQKIDQEQKKSHGTKFHVDSVEQLKELTDKILAVRMLTEAKRHDDSSLNKPISKNDIDLAVKELNQSPEYKAFSQQITSDSVKAILFVDKLVPCLTHGHGGRVEDLFKAHLCKKPAGELDNSDPGIAYFMPTAKERIEELKKQAEAKKRDSVTKEAAEILVLRNLVRAERNNVHSLEKKIPTTGTLKSQTKKLAGEPAFHNTLKLVPGVKSLVFRGHGGELSKKVIENKKRIQGITRELNKKSSLEMRLDGHYSKEGLEIVEKNTRGGRMKDLQHEARNIAEQLKVAPEEEKAGLINQAKTVMAEYKIHNEVIFGSDGEPVMNWIDKMNEPVQWSAIDKKVQRMMNNPKSQNLNFTAEQVITGMENIANRENVNIFRTQKEIWMDAPEVEQQNQIGPHDAPQI
ncbi:MAG: hypothetical protein J6P72_01870 [Firmicutes bacterium]|nr:hypothetical protein [Bacillota bacterium]